MINKGRSPDFSNKTRIIALRIAATVQAIFSLAPTKQSLDELNDFGGDAYDRIKGI